MRAALSIVGMVALGAGVSVAATTPKKPPKLARTVNLENKRPVALLHFEIVTPARDKTAEIVVVKLEKPLAAGASASLPLPGVEGCAHQARWVFEDVTDAGEVDLCGAAHIVLVD